jgi:hypothetical protein
MGFQTCNLHENEELHFFILFFSFSFILSIACEELMKRVRCSLAIWPWQRGLTLPPPHANLCASDNLFCIVRCSPYVACSTLAAAHMKTTSTNACTTTLIFRRNYKPINPYAVDFRLSPNDAAKAFDKHHEQSWLAPLTATLKANSDVRPVFLPFWVFEASVKATVSGEVRV